jgi:hypothetical protein
MDEKNPFSRREFLKMFAASLGGAAIQPWNKSVWKNQSNLTEFPETKHLGRVTSEFVNVRAKPDINSALVGQLNEDEVLPWIREVVGSMPNSPTKRWVETPYGYIWSLLIQPVKNKPNPPATTLRDTSLGSGMWVEVTVPWVDVRLENPLALAPWLSYRISQGKGPRLYCDQVIWVDQIDTDAQGQVWYRLNERFSYGDVFWGPAEAFRPMNDEDLAPISPEVENKRIEVNLKRQTLSCYEEDREVYFCRVSTGLDGEDTETEPGTFWIWRKMVSAHMAGGTVRAGYDTPAIGFATYFVGTGIAVHSTFWHNAYGEKRSHGCVNARPKDAKWVFRWTHPVVGYDPGDITLTEFTGTVIQVLED